MAASARITRLVSSAMVVSLGARGPGTCMSLMPGPGLREVPSLELRHPAIRVMPDDAVTLELARKDTNPS